MKREREKELIFRGESYAEAIRLFQKKNGRLPVSFEELHKHPNPFIRKLYKDPVKKVACEDCKGRKMVEADFTPIYAGPNGQPILPGQAAPGGVNPTAPGGTGGTATPSKPEGGATAPTTPPPTGSASPTPTSTFGNSFGTQAGGGPIIGVYSDTDEESIILYDGKDNYKEWFFVMKQQQPGQKGAPGGGTPPPPGGGAPPPPGGGTPPPPGGGGDK